MSSTEAEYLGASEEVKDIKFGRNIFIEFLPLTPFCHGPVPLEQDNKGARDIIAANSGGKGLRALGHEERHIDESVEDGVIKIKEVGSNETIADIGTKPIGRKKLWDVLNRINISIE